MSAAILVPSLQSMSLRTLTSSGNESGAGSCGRRVSCADTDPIIAASITTIAVRSLDERAGKDVVYIAIVRRMLARDALEAHGDIPGDPRSAGDGQIQAAMPPSRPFPRLGARGGPSPGSPARRAERWRRSVWPWRSRNPTADRAP